MYAMTSNFAWTTSIWLGCASHIAVTPSHARERSIASVASAMTSPPSRSFVMCSPTSNASFVSAVAWSAASPAPSHANASSPRD